jgi:hypothetical protein
MNPEPDYSQTSVGITDADVRATMLASIRLLAVLAVVAAALFWWKSGWQSALLVVIGAVIASASLWEWLRLMTALNKSMDARPDRASSKTMPMGAILFGFFFRLGLTVVILYASLKYLQGTVFALAAGIGLGLFSLTIEALRLMKRWTQ